MQSSAKATGRRRTRASASAIGRNDNSGTRLPFGRSKWLQMTTRAPPLGQLADRWRQPLDPGQVGDAAVMDRDVQVGAQQHAAPPYGDAVERADWHYRLPNRAAVSTMRLLKPHSLSYQPITRASWPSTTAVCVASKEQEAGLWLKSMLTSFSVL